MHVEPVELLPGQGVDDAKNGVFGIEVSGQVHVETTVFEFRLVMGRDGRLRCVHVSICVGVEKLVEGLQGP